MSAADERPLMELRAGAMRSPQHSALLYLYHLGQWRIQLTRVDIPDPDAPFGHGTIVRELCTYDRGKALSFMVSLAGVIDPEALCREVEQPWNCDYPGGRIRLDNEAGVAVGLLPEGEQEP